MEWQPIETAPKTSKAILIYCMDNKNTYTVTWARNEEFPWAGKWKHFAGDFINEVPTHWMPLPAPPSNGQGQRAAKPSAAPDGSAALPPSSGD